MDERASRLRDFIRVEESGNKLNSATYANYTKAEKWTREDTDFFYRATSPVRDGFFVIAASVSWTVSPAVKEEVLGRG